MQVKVGVFEQSPSKAGKRRITAYTRTYNPAWSDEHPAKHSHDGGRLCDDCRVVNAWTEPRPVPR